MIIWSGWGILAPFVAMLVGIPVALGLGALFQAAGLDRLLGVPMALGLVAAAAAVWFLGQRLNGAPGRELVDPRTGQRLILRPRHTLFFVPVQWWAVPLAAGAVIALVVSLVNPSALEPAGGAPATTRAAVKT